MSVPIHILITTLLPLKALIFCQVLESSLITCVFLNSLFQFRFPIAFASFSAVILFLSNLCLELCLGLNLQLLRQECVTQISFRFFFIHKIPINFFNFPKFFFPFKLQASFSSFLVSCQSSNLVPYGFSNHISNCLRVSLWELQKN